MQIWLFKEDAMFLWDGALTERACEALERGDKDTWRRFLKHLEELMARHGPKPW